MPRRILRALLFYFLSGLVLSTFAQAQHALDLAGHSVDPFSAGKVTVLIFVRSDCPISNRYAPEIQRLAREFDGIAKIWLVYPDRKETAQSVERHLNDYGYKIGALRDTHHELVRQSDASITPEAAVFYGSELRYHGRIDDRAIDFNAFRPTAGSHDLEDAIRAVSKGQPARKAAGSPVGCYISDLE